MTLKFSPQEIVYWEIERLIPSARNARTHSDKQTAEIAGSIKTFGMMSVILVDAEGGIIAPLAEPPEPLNNGGPN